MAGHKQDRNLIIPFHIQYDEVCWKDELAHFHQYINYSSFIHFGAPHKQKI